MGRDCWGRGGLRKVSPGLQRFGTTMVSSLGSWTSSIVISWQVEVSKAPGMPEFGQIAVGDWICGIRISWGPSGSPLAEAEQLSE